MLIANLEKAFLMVSVVEVDHHDVLQFTLVDDVSNGITSTGLLLIPVFGMLLGTECEPCLGAGKVVFGMGVKNCTSLLCCSSHFLNLTLG